MMVRRFLLVAAAFAAMIAASSAAIPEDPPPTQNIVEKIQHLVVPQKFTILVSALKAADLVDTLSSPSGNYTVFAPTDDAFKALPEGTLDDLLKPENKKKLADILTYHVLPTRFLTTDLPRFHSTNVTTVEGKSLHLARWGGYLRVGPSSEHEKNALYVDELATNGVVDVIDGVLLPPSSPTTASVSVRAEDCQTSLDGSCGGSCTIAISDPPHEGRCIDYNGQCVCADPPIKNDVKTTLVV